MIWIKKHWWKLTIVAPLLLLAYWMLCHNRRLALENKVLWEQEQHNRAVAEMKDLGWENLTSLDKEHAAKKDELTKEIMDLAGKPQELADRMNKLWGGGK